MKTKFMFHNERGYTFIIALLLIVLISVLGFALITISTNTLKVTKHERLDQSVFYIAEADLNVKRAEINSSLELILNPILDKYNNDDKFDMVKDRDKIEEEYFDAADNYLTQQLISEDGKLQKKYSEVTSYEKQNGLQPSSIVTLIKESQLYTYTLTSVAEIDGISRTISQTFTIKMPDFIEIKPGDEETPPPTNYNFCFGVLTNSFTTKNTLDTDADIVSLNDLTIDNTGTFENIYAKGSITIKNTPTVKGSMVSLADINFESAGTHGKDIIANGNINFISNNGHFNTSGNLFSMKNINIQKNIQTSSIGFVYANQHIINDAWPTIPGVVFGKESIKSSKDGNFALGAKRYSMGEIIYKQGNSTNNIRAKNEDEFNQFIVNENINLNYYYNQINNLKNAQGTSNGECGSQSLANAQIPQAPPFMNVASSSLLEIPDIALSWNTPNTISLTDNSYIKNVSLVGNRTLTIDVGDEDRTLVIDNLNGDGGHIEVKGTGKLNILVRNNLKILEFLSSNERSPFDTTIYYEGSNDLNITKTIQSNLYTKNSNVSIHNAGGGGMQGNIIVGGSHKLNVTGNTTFGNNNEHVVILVPNSSLNFQGSSQIFGTIVGNKVDAVGSNTTHKFDNTKLNLDLFSESQKSKYTTEGGFIAPDSQKEI
ncbi:hypothetical protein FOH38_16120 [Lysinibacillus fusiformis]|nr:hypothetical protein FOH38_16120 [Lysinibacillus fusiformis]